MKDNESWRGLLKRKSRKVPRLKWYEHGHMMRIEQHCVVVGRKATKMEVERRRKRGRPKSREDGWISEG